MFEERLRLITENKEYFEQFIAHASNSIYQALSSNKKLLFCGNGGSAAESQHMAAEYAATLDHKRPRDGMAAISLTTDTSFITAWSNDFGFETIFSRQISVLAQKGDVLICYSTSGNSKNIVNALNEALKKEMDYLIFSGFNENSDLAKISSKKNILHVTSDKTPLIQEMHTMLGHDICYKVEKLMDS